jgi:hypothetical protein
MPIHSGAFRYQRTRFALSFFLFVTSWSQISFAIGSAELEMKLEQSQFMSDAAYLEQSNQYSTFVPSFRGQSSNFDAAVTTKADLSALVPMTDEGEFHFIARDLYARVQTKSPTGLAFTFGRSQRLWSQLDEDWGLGIWQPLFRADYVNPISLGLTGLFAEAAGKGMKFTIFVSPLHLPDQQAEMKVENGQLTSGNRWFRAPVSHLEIEHGVNRIYYDLNKPEVKDVVFNGVFAFSTTAGDEVDGSWARFSFADKPMNQFHVAVQTDGIVFLHVDSGEIRPIIHPKVVRHQLATFETGFAWDDRNKVYFSVVSESINDPKLPEGWEQTELKDAYYVGAGGSMGMGMVGLRQTLFSLGYVERREKEGSDITSIEGEIETSNQRPTFERLASAALIHPLYRQRHHRVTGQMKYTHSFSDQGDWVTAVVNYRPEAQVTWYLGLDVFGAPDEGTGVRSFISSYRNNDRVFGGVSYVF